MGFIKNVAAIFMAGFALLFLKMAWKHIHTRDVTDIGTRVVIDLVFAAVFGYCAYALYRSAQAHYRRLAAKQEQQAKQEPLGSGVWPLPPAAFQGSISPERTNHDAE